MRFFANSKRGNKSKRGDKDGKKSKTVKTLVDLQKFTKCRTTVPPYYVLNGKLLVRQNVPDNLVPWNVEHPSYAPIPFTSSIVLENDVNSLPYDPKKWADPNEGVNVVKPNGKTVSQEIKYSQKVIKKHAARTKERLNGINGING